MDSAERRLEELLSRAESNWAESSRAELSRRLEECRVNQKKSELTLEQTDQQVFVAQDLQAEARSRQALVDLVELMELVELVERPSHGCSTDTDHRWRCEQNQFAEEQGRLSQRWLRLQAELSRQVRGSDWFRLFSSPWKQNRSYASGPTAGRTWRTFRFLSGVRMVPE